MGSRRTRSDRKRMREQWQDSSKEKEATPQKELDFYYYLLKGGEKKNDKVL